MHCKIARQAARAAGLCYVRVDQPGIRRERCGKGFRYYWPSGARVTHPAVLERIRSLVIPPAYEDVWICREANGHLQAVGIDARGRKQYRYHPDWRRVRDENKFDRMYDFGRRLPAIRKQVKHDLCRRGLPKEKVLAAVVALLERTLIRVGNDEYAKENGSYGLTTLRNHHARVEGERIVFRFLAKSSKKRRIDLKDRQLANIVSKLQDLPGQELFQYQDSSEMVHSISSGDVNEYLQRIAGHDFTAKDFRTWYGTVLALVAFRETMSAEQSVKRRLVDVVQRVAERLANTPAVCRKSYIHPAGLEYCACQGSGNNEKRCVSVCLSRTLEREVLSLLRPSAGGRRP